MSEKQQLLEQHRRFARAMLGAGCALLLCASPALSFERPSRDDIVRALGSQPVSRSLTGESAQVTRSPAEQRLLEDLRRSPTRSLSASDRETLKVAAHDRKSIDLEVYFDRNSAAIGHRGAEDLQSLGEALGDPSLKGATFMIGGHTDARGSDGYNQKLSERRAIAVKTWLEENAHISAEKLVAVGYGKDEYKNPHDPYAPENRRVQIVNLDAKATARQ